MFYNDRNAVRGFGDANCKVSETIRTNLPALKLNLLMSVYQISKGCKMLMTFFFSK